MLRGGGSLYTRRAIFQFFQTVEDFVFNVFCHYQHVFSESNDSAGRDDFIFAVAVDKGELAGDGFAAFFVDEIFGDATHHFSFPGHNTGVFDPDILTQEFFPGRELRWR